MNRWVRFFLPFLAMSACVSEDDCPVDRFKKYDVDLQHMELIYNRPVIAISGKNQSLGIDFFAAASQCRWVNKIVVSGSIWPVGAIASLTKLPRLEQFFAAESSLTNAEILTLVRAQELRALNLASTQVSGIGVRSLSSLKKLEILNLNELAVNDEDIMALGELINLREVYLENTQVSGRGWQAIHWPKLEQISLSNTNFSDYTIEALLKFQYLAYLSIENTNISNTFLPLINRFRFLQVFDFSSTKINSLDPIFKLPHISDIRARDNKLSISFADEIKPPSLLALDLANSKLNPDLLKYIKNLKTLSVLNLSNTGLVDSDMKVLHSLSRLRKLDLSGNKLTGSGFAYLKSFLELRELNLDDTTLDDKFSRAFRMFPNLQKLSLARTPVTRETMSALREKSNLQVVEF